MDVSWQDGEHVKQKIPTCLWTDLGLFEPLMFFVAMGKDSSFDSSSFNESLYITIAFFIMSFLDTWKPLLRYLRIHSRTDLSNFSLKSCFPAPSIRILFNFLFLTVFQYYSHIHFWSSLNFLSVTLFPWNCEKERVSSSICKGQLLIFPLYGKLLDYLLPW